MRRLFTGSAALLLAFATYANVFAFTNEGHFRWRNDDGGEISATWRQAENTGDTLSGRSNIRLRVELDNTNSGSASGAVALYYSTDGINFTQITTDSSVNDWVLSRSAHFFNGDSTTSQLTDSVAFYGGEMVDSLDSVPYSFSSVGADEYEFCIAPTSHAESGKVYYFRMQDPTIGPFTNPSGYAYSFTATLLYLNGTGAVTKPATNIAFTSAVVSGTVFPDSIGTTVYVHYGTTPGTHKDSMAVSQSPVSGDTLLPVSASLTGLSSGTTYYYYVSASNSKGYARGDEMEFATSSYSAGSALKFNYANSDYVETPLVTSSNTDFTIECWVKWGGTTGATQPVFFNGFPTTDGYGVTLDNTNSDKLSVVFGNFPSATTTNSDSTLPVGKWTHIALTMDGSNNWVLYMNGDSVAGGNRGAGQPTGNFYIGGNGSSSFNGSIDEVRFYLGVLDSTQIRLDMHRTLVASQEEPALYGYWEFNEGSGASVNDLSTHGNGGTLDNFAFNSSDGWVASTAPLGYGSSADTNGFTSGTANLGTVSVTTSDAFDNPVELVGTEIQSAPDSLPTGSAVLLNNLYWVITPYGAPGTFSTNLTFTVPSSFTANGTASASTYTLYHRGDDEDGAWTPVVNGAASVTATSITFDGVTSFSQFMIGSSDVSLAVQATDFAASSDVNSVTLTWKTRSEVNNAGFDILREDPGTDSYKLIGSYASDDSLLGLGTSSVGRSYDFTDNHVTPGATYQYRIESVSTSGTTKDLSTLSVTVNVPKTYALHQNYPNPFNPATTISYDLSANSHVTLKIYDILGREVATLVNGEQNAGVYKVNFNASRYASGVYFYRIDAEGNNGQKYVAVRKLVLMK
jgi:Concanavalin A-like lectin/glucanases superfamily/Secretion system C-terminal sorting domain